MTEDDETKMKFDPDLWMYTEDDEAQFWLSKIIDPALGYGWVILDRDAASYQWEACVRPEKLKWGWCVNREEAMEIVKGHILDMMEECTRWVLS